MRNRRRWITFSRHREPEAQVLRPGEAFTAEFTFTKRMDWPHIYRVTLRGIRSEQRVQNVLSWLGEYKAVAMVVEGHAGGWFGPKKTWPVFSVNVEDLGPAPADKNGTVGIPKGCWDDRTEF